MMSGRISVAEQDPSRASSRPIAADHGKGPLGRSTVRMGVAQAETRVTTASRQSDLVATLRAAFGHRNDRVIGTVAVKDGIKGVLAKVEAMRG